MLGAVDKTPDSASQAVIAAGIIVAVTVLGIGLMILAYEVPSQSASALTAVGTVIGGLLTALNAPSGIGKVIAAATAPKPQAPTGN